MQYVVSITTHLELQTKTKEGQTMHRFHARTTHVPVHSRKHAALIADAINESTSGFRMSASTYEAEVGVRMCVRKGTIVLTFNELEQIATEAHDILSAAD